MNTSARPANSANPRSSWRFTIADLMMCILGVAVGLAVTRIARTAWSDALLVSFAVWYTLGSWSQAMALSLAIRHDSALKGAIPAMLVAIAARVAAPLVSICGITLLLVEQSGFLRAHELELGEHTEAYRFLCVGLIFVPVMTLAVPVTNWRTSRRGISRAWKAVVATGGAVAGVALALAVAFDLLLVPFLIHTAIGRVLHAQLTLTTIEHFQWTTICAALLWLATGFLLIRLARRQPGERSAKYVAALLGISLLTLVLLTVASSRMLATQISPIMAGLVFSGKAEVLWWMGSLFLGTCSLWLMVTLLRGPYPADATVTVNFPDRATPWLHDWLLVLVLPCIWSGVALFEVVYKALDPARGPFDWDSLLYDLSRVDWFFKVAYILAWLHIAWSRRKGHAVATMELRRVSYRRLVALGLGSLALVTTGAPIVAQLCFAYGLAPDTFPGANWFSQLVARFV